MGLLGCTSECESVLQGRSYVPLEIVSALAKPCIGTGTRGGHTFWPGGQTFGQGGKLLARGHTFGQGGTLFGQGAHFLARGGGTLF